MSPDWILTDTDTHYHFTLEQSEDDMRIARGSERRNKNVFSSRVKRTPVQTNHQDQPLPQTGGWQAASPYSHTTLPAEMSTSLCSKFPSSSMGQRKRESLKEIFPRGRGEKMQYLKHRHDQRWVLLSNPMQLNLEIPGKGHQYFMWFTDLFTQLPLTKHMPLIPAAFSVGNTKANIPALKELTVQ